MSVVKAWTYSLINTLNDGLESFNIQLCRCQTFLSYPLLYTLTNQVCKETVSVLNVMQCLFNENNAFQSNFCDGYFDCVVKTWSVSTSSIDGCSRSVNIFALPTGESDDKHRKILYHYTDLFDKTSASKSNATKENIMQNGYQHEIINPTEIVTGRQTADGILEYETIEIIRKEDIVQELVPHNKISYRMDLCQSFLYDCRRHKHLQINSTSLTEMPTVTYVTKGKYVIDNILNLVCSETKSIPHDMSLEPTKSLTVEDIQSQCKTLTVYHLEMVAEISCLDEMMNYCSAAISFEVETLTKRMPVVDLDIIINKLSTHTTEIPNIYARGIPQQVDSLSNTKVCLEIIKTHCSHITLNSDTLLKLRYQITSYTSNDIRSDAFHRLFTRMTSDRGALIIVDCAKVEKSKSLRLLYHKALIVGCILPHHKETFGYAGLGFKHTNIATLNQIDCCCDCRNNKQCETIVVKTNSLKHVTKTQTNKTVHSSVLCTTVMQSYINCINACEREQIGCIHVFQREKNGIVILQNQDTYSSLTKTIRQNETKIRILKMFEVHLNTDDHFRETYTAFGIASTAFSDECQSTRPSETEWHVRQDADLPRTCVNIENYLLLRETRVRFRDDDQMSSDSKVKLRRRYKDLCQNEKHGTKETSFEHSNSSSIKNSESPDEQLLNTKESLKANCIATKTVTGANDTDENIVDLKRKGAIMKFRSKDYMGPNKSYDHKNIKHPHIIYQRDDYVNTIRTLTWLPLDQLPVPQVDFTLAFVFEPLNNIFTQMARDKTPGPEITMRYELLRLCTLRNYPKENKPYIIRLAGAGFYYAAEGDEVVCYCCGLRRNSWTEIEVPSAIHQRISPRCSFLTKNADVNVPVPKPDRPGPNRFAFLEEQVETSNNKSRATDLPAHVNNNSNSSNEHSREECLATNSSRAQHTSGNLSRITGNSANNSSLATLGVGNQQGSDNFVGSNSEARIAPTTSHHITTPSAVNTEKPKYPSYAAKSVRVASFQGWPNNIGKSAEVMADAGFYFAGVGDAVRCFFCGIGLRHWTSEDNPWIEHARWSRQCVYVKMIKGEEYINLVHLAMQLTQDPEEQAGAVGGESASHIPIEEINNILLTAAAQSVLDMGYTPKIIKQAIEIILRETGRSGISSTNIMAKVLELEDKANALVNELSQLTVTTQGSATTINNQTVIQNVARQTPSIKQTTSPIQSSSANVPRQTNSTTQSLSNVTYSFGHQSQPSWDIANQRLGQMSARRPVAQATSSKVASSKHDVQSNKEKHQSGTPMKDSKSLKAENDRMQEQTMCKVCMDKTVCIVFLPCGHLVTCAECAPAMRKCPICRTLVKGTVKAFIS